MVRSMNGTRADSHSMMTIADVAISPHRMPSPVMSPLTDAVMSAQPPSCSQNPIGRAMEVQAAT